MANVVKGGLVGEHAKVVQASQNGMLQLCLITWTESELTRAVMPGVGAGLNYCPCFGPWWK